MLRLIHNRSIVKYVLATVGIIIAGYFAWSFYPFGEWSGKTFLPDVPGASTLLGLICAGILGGLVLLMLFHKEYMKEDVRAYGLLKGDKSYEHALNMFVWFVMAMEGASILFRVIILNTNKYTPVLVGVGVVGMVLTYIIGKVMHAQVNRPAEVEAERVMNDAKNSVMEDAGRDLNKLTADEKRRIGEGDLNPLNRISDYRNARRWKKQRAAEQKAQERDRRDSEAAAARERSRKAAEKFLKPRSDDPVDFIEMPSQSSNGNGAKSFH